MFPHLFFLLWITLLPLLVSGQCDVQLTDNEGMVRSPGYPLNYSNNLDCSWTIQAGANQQVAVTFTTINLEDCETCDCDYILIRDGPDATSPVISRYCGEHMTAFTFLSTGNAMRIQFITNEEQEETLSGFSFNYTKVPACGGTFTTHNGTIMSPTFNNAYPNNANCTYEITVDPSKHIFFKVDRLILQEKNEESNICVDYLEVKEHSFNTGLGTLGRYCAEIDPFSVITSGNTIWMQFISDNLTTSAGFTIEWESLDCDTTYTEDTGMIESPRFQDLYPSNSNCTYSITVTPGKMIHLKFSEFMLEEEAMEDVAAMPGTDCTDFLEIRDTSTSRILEVYCGTKDPFSFVSTSNTLWLYFQSNFVFNQRGFKAEYEAIDTNIIYRSHMGNIKPPSFGEMYANNINNNFTIIRAEGEPIFLTIVDFEVQEPNANGTCIDYLMVGFDKFCGEKDPLTYLFFGSTSFSFVSDLMISGMGFSAQYDVCNTTISDSSGELRSPGYPAFFYQNISCSYRLQQSYERIYRLNISEFSLPEKVNGMCQSYVRFRDAETGYISVTTRSGNTVMSETMLCGNLMPFVVMTTSKEVIVELETAPANLTVGFHLRFSITDIPTTTSTPAVPVSSEPPPTTTERTGNGGSTSSVLSAPIIAVIAIVGLIVLVLAVVCVLKMRANRRDHGSLEMLSGPSRRSAIGCSGVYNPAYDSNDELDTVQLKGGQY